MFFAKNKTKEVMLVIDIGSSSVGAALVSASEGQAPKILFSTRQHTVLQNEQFGQQQSFAGIMRALELAMKKIAAKHIKIDRSHIVFSSPWHISKTSTFRIDHETPTVITHDVINKLIEEAEKKFLEELHPDDEAIEHRVIRTKLNGYDTPNPHNKKAKSLEMTFLGSVVPKKVLEPVRCVIEKYFHAQKKSVSSFPVAIFSAISGIMPDKRDYLIIDVRGETTELTIVADGVLIKSLSFPYGKNALAKTIATASGHSVATALSLLNTAIAGHSESSVRTSILKFAETFKQAWLKEHLKTLQEIYAGLIVPQTIFLITDSDIELFFENILDEIKKKRSLHTLKHLKLKSYVEKSSALTDLFLALESIFVTMT